MKQVEVLRKVPIGGFTRHFGEMKKDSFAPIQCQLLILTLLLESIADYAQTGAQY